jgi:hypothetical protein
LLITESVPNSKSLPRERIPDSEPKKVEIPASNRQKAVTKKPEEKVTQESQFTAEVRAKSVKRGDELNSALPAPEAGELDFAVRTAS